MVIRIRGVSRLNFNSTTDTPILLNGAQRGRSTDYEFAEMEFQWFFAGSDLNELIGSVDPSKRAVHRAWQ